ncbi:MAG: PHP domain-containing protein [Hungatella sp.]|nr:PHP domain-containing protein [Hungatella sp.]
MNYVDLHVHSSASDGTLSPSEVVAYAISRNLKAIALTDHDTIDGIAQARKAAEGTGLELIPGIELSCFYGDTEIHILGLYIDDSCPALKEGLSRLVRIREMRNEAMLNRFQEDGFDITIEDLRHGNPDTVITRAHFARVLTEKGYVPSMDKAFTKYLQYGGRYCSRKEVVTPEQSMELLSQAGAWPCLAHPMQYHLGYDQIGTLVSRLKDMGLKGLEVYHSSQNPHQSSRLKEIAGAWGLLPSGGSDFHGANKPDIDMGTGRGGLRISYSLLKDIKMSHFKSDK